MRRPSGVAGRLARYGFTDIAAAVGRLGPTGLGLWDEQRQQPVDEPAEGVLGALGAGADPDLALRQLLRFGPSALADLRDDPALCRRVVAVLGASIPLGDDLAATGAAALRVTALGTDPPSAPELLAGMSTADGQAAPAGLRSAYRAELVRIAADDLTGVAGLEQTMTRLAGLADATLVAALAIAMAERGHREPRLCVVAMGKCGGRELNYVSDVDVIFVCDDDADLTEAQLVAARLMQICAAAAWPVDASLRPEGSQGPLVRTLAAQGPAGRR
jgi:glutamate-ammonia-ligase adenylyltransferase